MSIRAKFLANMFLFALVAAVIGLHAAAGAFDLQVVGTSDEVMSIRDNATNSPADIAARFDCWGDDEQAPADVAIPGHVVVAVPVDHVGPIAPAGVAVVDAALGQVWDNEDNGLAVYAFCR